MLHISSSKHTGPITTQVPKHIQSNIATTKKCAHLRLSHSQEDPQLMFASLLLKLALLPV